MAFKKLIFLSFLLSTAEFTFGQNQDSVIYEVFNFLTGDAVKAPANTDALLNGFEWEALAYWDNQDPREIKYMQEAVGDIYQFIAKSFTIKTVNPENPATYLPAITGSFLRKDSTFMLTSQAGKQLPLQLIFIDSNYLILEIDGLRIFFTKTKSYPSR